MSNESSPEVVRAALSRMGKLHSDVARELGVDRTIVRGVLYGHLKGVRGDAHKVAVALGMKRGVIVGDTMPIANALKAALAV